MKKIKFSNNRTFEIPINSIASTDDTLVISFLAPDDDLLMLEEMLLDNSNTEKIYVLSETDEVLRIYSRYVRLESIEKKKDVVISTEIDDYKNIVKTGDVITIRLGKENMTENRLVSLEKDMQALNNTIGGM